MIDLKALKEQLKLLGHDLPDEQVMAILKEMNIDFDDTPGEHGQDTQALPRTGSILDNFQGRQQPDQPNACVVAVAPTQSCAPQGFNYGYTSPTRSAPVVLNHGKVAGGMPPVFRPVQGPEDGIGEGCGPQGASSEYSDDCYDHDSDENNVADEPASCRYPATVVDQPRGANGQGSKKAWAEGASLSNQAAGRPSNRVNFSDLGQQGRGPSDLAGRLGRVTLNEPAVGCADRPSSLEEVGSGVLGRKGMEAVRPSSTTRTQRPGTATAAKDQHRKHHDSHRVMPKDRDTHATLLHTRGVEEEEEGDVALSDPDKNPGIIGVSNEDLEWRPPGGRVGAPGSSAQHPYQAWLGGGPVDARLAEALLAQGQLSPQGSNRSFASRATSRCSIGSKRGAKKVDRVQRYQQLQQEWSQNRFLKQAGGASRGTSRKPVNFHSHFASLHAAEEAERQRMLRETRARTKKELGSATEAPTANRRDELRWQTRMRLKEQT